MSVSVAWQPARNDWRDLLVAPRVTPQLIEEHYHKTKTIVPLWKPCSSLVCRD